ncbi:MAG TPA: enolase C-terminal domain-like protein [Candidatus Binatus sp.]|nr:enolase C-terminal domain-like protein [Candidatus Binatus sp.]
MNAIETVRAAYEKATGEFSDSAEFVALISGQAPPQFVREFLRNVFRTHYLSAHIVALCYAALPSKTGALLLKENLLEEMGHSENEPPHSALLIKLAQEIGMGQAEIDRLIDDARRRVAIFSASRVPFATLREICLAVLIETLSFEFMLSRCSGKIAAALRDHYAIPSTALSWFELHSEVDIRHAEEGITVIDDYLAFHAISDAAFDLIQRVTLNRVFTKHYFPPNERSFALPAATSRSVGSIESITIYKLAIAFHQAFRHAAQSRFESDAIIVRIKDRAGETGYGEALPRPYVTGEDSESAIGHIRDRLVPAVFAERWSPGWQLFDALAAMNHDWTRSSESKVIAWNAAFCAVELALLDWGLKSIDSTLADFLAPARLEVVYSGVISSDQPAEAAALAQRMVKFGLRQLKVKVGTDDDFDRLAAVRQAVGPEVALRADANGVWSTDQAIEQLNRLAPFNLQWIEQPVAAGDFGGMKRVSQETGIPTMADESLVTPEQARQLIEQRACDYFNIRLSKNGGITGSLAIAKLAADNGIKIQVGAQVGETAILSAAGRTFAAHLPAIACAEGSFGTWLLSEDIAFEDLSFGYAGIAPLLRTRGLSVTVKDESLERLAIEKIQLNR